MKVIDDLNSDPDVTEFIVQLPLPKHLQSHVLEVIREPLKNTTFSVAAVRKPLANAYRTAICESQLRVKRVSQRLLRAIDPKKDIDGFGAYNIGKTFLSVDFEHLPPATPSGVIEMLTFYKIGIEGKHAVVVGRSN